MCNKYQDALDRLANIDLDRVSDLLSLDKATLISDYAINEYPNLEKQGDIKLLQGLVTQATYEKPFESEVVEGQLLYHCPACGRLNYVWANYCCNCGKKIKDDNTNNDVQSIEMELIEELSAAERDRLYRKLWYPYVVEDVEKRIDDLNIKLTENQIDNIATAFVYDGEYDCNLTYWDNIDNLIDRYK